MTEEELIEKYLDRYYTVLISDKPKEAGDFSIISSHSSVNYTKNKIENELYTIFGERPIVKKTFEHWYGYVIRLFCQTFNEFLDNCYMELGPTNWVVKHKIHGEVDRSALETYYSGALKPHISTLTTLFDRWYDIKVLEASERLMRHN